MQAPWTLAPPLRAHTCTLAAWTPLIALLLAVVLVALLLENVVNCGSWFGLSGTCAAHVPTVQLLPGRPFAELSGRILWAISILLFGLAITSTYSVALWAILRGFPTMLHRAAALALGVATPLLMFELLPAGQDFEFNLWVLRPTVYAISSAEGYVQVVGILGTSALFFLAIAASGVLLQARRTRAPAAPLPDEVAVLAASQERIRTLLYAGALSLVAGTLQSSALYSWAGSMLASQSIGMVGSGAINYFEKSTDIAQTMGMLNGSFYSLMLATIFVPAFALLRVKALRMAHEADPAATPAARKAWLEGKGIGASIHTQLVTAAALLAPAITGGPVTTLLSMFN